MKSFTQYLKENMESKPLKFCVDLSGTYNHNLFSIYNAYIERPENVLNESYQNIMGSDSLLEQNLIEAKKNKDFNKIFFLKEETRQKLNELAMYQSLFWQNGRTLRVKFLGGTSSIHEKIKEYAGVWEQYANIHFTFVNSGDAEIRIAFQSGGSWSHIGTNSLTIPQSDPSMNFGWFDTTTSEDDFSSTILHEFGHALGCIHEHQSPAATLKWDKPVVYKEYLKSQRWNADDVNKNVFQRYDQQTITNSDYDADSIMHYSFPTEFFISGSAVEINTKLSSGDIEFIQKAYPKP